MANTAIALIPLTRMNERIKRSSIGAAIFLLSLVPLETNFSQEQGQLIKPCMAETTPKKKEDTTRKKGRKRQRTKDEKKDSKDQQQAKGSNCN